MNSSIFTVEEKENYLYIKALIEDLSISSKDSDETLKDVDNKLVKNIMFDFEKVVNCDATILKFLQKANAVVIEKDGFIVICNVSNAVKEQIESIQSPQEIHASYTFSEAEDYLYMVELEKELGDLDEDFTI